MMDRVWRQFIERLRWRTAAITSRWAGRGRRRRIAWRVESLESRELLSVASPVAVSATAGMQTDLFSIGPDQFVREQKFNAANDLTLASRVIQPGAAVSSIAAVTLPNGAPLLFAIGLDQQVYEAKFDVAGDLSGSFFLTQPASVTSIAATTDAAGNPLLLAIGSDGQVYDQRFDGSGNLTAGFSLVAQGAVSTLSASGPVLFARGLDQQLYESRFNGTTWSSFTLPAPGAVESFAWSAASGLVLAVGGDQQLYAQKIDAAGNSGGWFLAAAGGIKELSQTQFGANTVVSVIGLDDQVYLLKFDAAGNPAGGYQAASPGAVLALTAWNLGAAAPVLFVVGLDGAIYAQKLDASGNPSGGYLATAQVNLPAANSAFPQLSPLEVQALLNRAAAITPTQSAIVAVVDRGGHILGVRVQQGVLDTIPDSATRVFAIDGAVAEARTAAFFSNGDPGNIDSRSPQGTLGPLTSRTIRFISQSTVTQREVESNPNISDPNSTVRGPGFVAPIGLGGHFPPEVPHTPPVDLFAIEHSNRDSIVDPGPDGIRGTADDFTLRGRFNIDPAFVPPGQTIDAPESFGFVSGLLPNAQSRGIGTLPGGIPLFRDTNGDGVGDTLIGGIGVFFPGPDGYATHEQGFVAGIGQTELARTNAPLELTAEAIALLAAGGSTLAEAQGAAGAKSRATALDSVGFVAGLDVPFGRLDLVGVQLQVIGPTAGIEGVQQLLNFAQSALALTDPLNGADVQVAPGGEQYLAGQPVPEGWLVTPHASTVDNISAADVTSQINAGIAAAEQVRSAIRLNADGTGGAARARMVLAVADTTGEILGLYRMRDATVFSIDVAVAKSRNTAYYADPAALQTVDQVPGIAPGVAFSNRTFRFIAEPRFPSGVDGSAPPVFSILNDPGINPATGENLGAPAPASAFQTVLGYDAFHPMTNFRDPGNDSVVAIAGPGVSTRTANQNGVIFFPGSTPLYRGSGLIGGLGISGDGVDQDDVVSFLAAQGYLPDGTTVLRADQVSLNGVALPYIKFLRNPFG